MISPSKFSPDGQESQQQVHFCPTFPLGKIDWMRVDFDQLCWHIASESEFLLTGFSGVVAIAETE